MLHCHLLLHFCIFVSQGRTWETAVTWRSDINHKKKNSLGIFLHYLDVDVVLAVLDCVDVGV